MIPALIVPVLTRYDLLTHFVARIDYPVAQLVIIDNGNQKPSIQSDFVESVSVVSVPFNLGVPASWNLGIKVTPLASYWLISNFDVAIPAGGLQRIHEQAKTDAVVLSGVPGRFFCFTVGEKVIEWVGLFCEGIYPAYFEDNDFHHRCNVMGIPVIESGVQVEHANSSTLHSSNDFISRNNVTFQSNGAFFEQKKALGDISAGEWSLLTVRKNRWT